MSRIKNIIQNDPKSCCCVPIKCCASTYFIGASLLQRFVFYLEMLNFYVHFLSGRTTFTTFTDVIVTIFTNRAEQNIFLYKVPKIALGLQHCCWFGEKPKASTLTYYIFFGSSITLTCNSFVLYP